MKKVRAGELYIFQGTSDFFNGKMLDFGDKLEALKKKIREFHNLKNIYYFFGSGTSSGAIPTMKGLSKTLIFSDAEKRIKNIYEHIKVETKDDLESCLHILYAARTYFESQQEEQQQENLQLYNELITKIETHIFEKLDITFTKENEKRVLGYYQKFYQNLARRSRDNSRICVFTTNNDLFNEMAMDSLNINYINGFIGGLHRVFNPAIFNFTWSKRMDTSIDKYEPIENLVYLYKIHGSINWREATYIENTYFEIEEVTRSEINSEQSPVLIYPTPTKQDKSLGSPYVDLFREFQNKLLEPHSVLFVIGYSFSDRHVNDIIYRALATNSSLNLVIFSKKPEDYNEEEKKPIFFVDDKRIFIIHGSEYTNADAPDADAPIGDYQLKRDMIIHHFDYIVNEILPDIDAYSEEDEMLKKFINGIKSEMKKDEDRENNID